jgi:hypothetical protein
MRKLYCFLACFFLFFTSSCAHQSRIPLSELEREHTESADGSSVREESEDSASSSDPYLIDEIETLSFEDIKDKDVADEQIDSKYIRNSTLLISISSDYYRVSQYRGSGSFSLIKNASRQSRSLKKLSRYNRINLRRYVQARIRVSRKSGRLLRYRLVKSSYVRELDNIVMADLAGLRFKTYGRRFKQDFIVTYVIRLEDRRGE